MTTYSSEQAALSLDEDALALWKLAIRNATTIEDVNGSPGLHTLLPLLVTLIAKNIDLLGNIVDILESYILLDANRLLQVSNTFNCIAYLFQLSVIRFADCRFSWQSRLL